MRSPFVPSAVLIAVHGDSALRELQAPSPPAVPHLDRICRDGVSTAVMLTPAQLAAAARDPAGLHPQLESFAEAGGAAVASLQAGDAASALANDDPPRRIHLVAARTLAEADRAAAAVAAALPAPRAHAPARRANPAAAVAAAALLGVMVTAPGDWVNLLSDPCRASFADALPAPRQSFQVGTAEEEQPRLAGFVVWSGAGLVRCDTRQFLVQRGCAPGEGYLRLDQVVAEVLAKTGLVDKYGA